MSEDTKLLPAFRGALATDLLSFLDRAFRDLDPRNELLIVPYVNLLADILQQIARGSVRRLIINLPPRHLKSILCSVVFPPWLLGRDPRLRIAVVSHSRSLAHDLALRSRRLAEVDWYRDTFPHVRFAPDRTGSMDFETTEGGGRFAASIDTGITGRGFDIIIVDDPLSAQDARSEAERTRVIEAYDTMIASRLDDPLRGAILIVHQRMHEDDLTGYLMNQGGWRQISLPLIAEEKAVFHIGSRLWTREVGETLVPALYPPDAIRDIRAARGEAIFATQYQQNPAAYTGELLAEAHIRYFDELPPSARSITLSFDTATKTTESSSYTVCLVVARDSWRHYVINVLRGRLDPVQARDAALELILQHKPTSILIEDASSGPGLARMLEERGHRCELRPTRGHSKEERFERHLGMFVEGRVLVARDEPWRIDLVNEWLRFPLARHDDQVDAISQYLEWVCEKPFVKPVMLGAGGIEQRRARIFSPPLRRGEHSMRSHSARRRRLFP